ncbi:MAG TPA: DoxX family protein [Nocardioidaceae bacterium]|nr:DoxX family protein [Nocardioidaceae bacterium]
MSKLPRDVAVLAAAFAGSGVLHFVRPEPLERIVPKPLPYKRELVYASGAAELACAAGLVRPRTRRVAGWASAGLLVGVFPANVQMSVSALRSHKAPRWYQAATLARLPLQIPMIKTAMKAARSPR